MGPAGGSSSSRRVDPRADLREATERNAREAREEREAAEKVAAQAAKEQADAAAKAQAEDGDVRRGDVVGVGGVVASIPIWIEGVRGEWGEWRLGSGGSGLDRGLGWGLYRGRLGQPWRPDGLLG